MPPRRVIGIDAGGTKLLGGVVDEDLVVHHRVHRVWRGADRQETLNIFLDSVEEVRAAAPDVEAVGFGIPALVEWETGVARWSNHLPLQDVRFRDLMSERLGLPVVVDNDGNASVLAECRAGRWRGGASRRDGLARHGNRHGPLSRRARVPGRRRGSAPRSGTRCSTSTAANARAPAPGVAASRRSSPATRSAGRACASREERPESALGKRLAAGREITGGIVTELAHSGDPAAREVLAEIGMRLGYGLVGVINVFNPEVIVIGGGAVRAGELLLEPARQIVSERAMPPVRAGVAIRPAHFGDEAGMMGAALLAFDQLVEASA